MILTMALVVSDSYIPRRATELLTLFASLTMTLTRRVPYFITFDVTYSMWMLLISNDVTGEVEMLLGGFIDYFFSNDSS